MAKSARSSQIKANNQRLKKNVFGPVEAARNERLSAKLMELIAQPKPEREVEMEVADEGMLLFSSHRQSPPVLIFYQTPQQMSRVAMPQRRKNVSAIFSVHARVDSTDVLQPWK